MADQSTTGFVRLASLLRAGYRFQNLEGAECAFLEHPAGRKFPHWRVMVYDNGTVVGMKPEGADEEMRIRSFDSDQFNAFLRTVPQHTPLFG